MAQKAPSPIDDPDATLEIFILVVQGLFMVLYGVLLFGIDAGKLRYAPDSTYGLLLVIIAFQAITLGKTPFGDFRRSWVLVIIGFIAAAIGLFGCFVPGVSSTLLRTLVGVIFIIGGIALSAQLWISREKARAWLRAGGVTRHLTVASALVYLLMLILGIRTLLPGIMTDTETAVILVAFGLSIFYLAGALWQARRVHPVDAQARSADSTLHIALLQNASLPLGNALIILLGTFLILLGLLLFPVGLGLLPFSPDGQFGALLTIMAIQVACLGQTPFGQFRRPWLIMSVGIIFAGLGIISAIVPVVLTDAIRILIGILNIAGGAVALITVYVSFRAMTRSGEEGPPAPLPPELKKLAINQTAQGAAGILFGVTMLVPGLIPLLIVPFILVAYGLLLFWMVRLMSAVARLAPA